MPLESKGFESKLEAMPLESKGFEFKLEAMPLESKGFESKLGAMPLELFWTKGIDTNLTFYCQKL